MAETGVDSSGGDKGDGAAMGLKSSSAHQSECSFV